MKKQVLIVDDERVIIDVLTKLLTNEGYEVTSKNTATDGLKEALTGNYDLLILDIMLPDKNGLNVLEEINSVIPDFPVIMMTAFGSVETAVKAMKMGAQEYVMKPFNNDEVLLQVKKVIEHHQLKKDYTNLLKEREIRFRIEHIIGKSSIMEDIFKMIKLAAPSKSTVLIQGESGTGKELIAGAIHSNSTRSDKPFITVNTSTIPRDLLEATLFGHTKGAFTGAVASRKGLLEAADTGTIFFDEIGNITPEIQAKLLRAIQERSFIPLGTTSEVQVDLRIIAATNLDLEKAMKEGEFREDLFYRLNVINIKVPPLRERIDDLELLVDHFLKKYSAENNKEILVVTPQAMKTLKEYHWPGNVREVENIIERATVLATTSKLDIDLIPDHIKHHKRVYSPSFIFPKSGLSLKEEIEKMEIYLIKESLRASGGVQKEAAKMLSLKPTTLHEMMRRLNISGNNLNDEGEEGTKEETI
ncbi:MAG: sigma-54-dependent Fis family transcriptional regulator [Acidobacteria bacterium]|nr:sigma-54-dependent Fis family transcriptional regulator [Acidobacteriota bacterium]